MAYCMYYIEGKLWVLTLTGTQSTVDKFQLRYVCITTAGTAFSLLCCQDTEPLRQEPAVKVKCPDQIEYDMRERLILEIAPLCCTESQKLVCPGLDSPRWGNGKSLAPCYPYPTPEDDLRAG
jgi:hypothetical protein